jgi:hypothetical protein
MVVDLTGARWLLWSRKLATPREASPRWVGAPGPTEEERGRPVRSADGELVTKIEVEMAVSVPADNEAGGVNKTHGGGGPFLPMRLEDRRDIMDGSMHARGRGTARCGVEVEHTCTVQTTARTPVQVASHEGYTERSLSIHRYPG